MKLYALFSFIHFYECDTLFQKWGLRLLGAGFVTPLYSKQFKRFICSSRNKRLQQVHKAKCGRFDLKPNPKMHVHRKEENDMKGQWAW